jgi:molybdate transport system regulatory protein
VGRDRIALLEAVALHGSISKAAEIAGFSYKTAWDAVNAINNLLPRPAFLTKAGGKNGGGAEVTEEGRRLITAFRRLEEKLSLISATIAEDGLAEDHDLLFWSVAVKVSARNAFHCRVVEVKKAKVNVEIILRVSDANTITAIVTNEAVAELDLVPGRIAMALVKSSFVTLAHTNDLPLAPMHNRFTGIVTKRIDDGVDSEVILDIGDSKTMTAVVLREKAEALSLQPGDKVYALFKAGHVTLAVD